MDAVFINGPFIPGFSRESRSPAVAKSGTLYYPGWLAYACGYVESKGYKCSLIDSIASRRTYDESVIDVVSLQPRVVFIGSSTPSISDDAKFALGIKSMLPSALICFVGTHVSSVPDLTLSTYPVIDLICRKEFDLTAADIVERSLHGLDWRSIDGISYRSGDIVVNNPDRPYIENLDDLPFASQIYKKHLNIRDYYYGHVKYPMVSIFTSRGCNAKCTYCVYPQTMFGKYRSRSPRNIAAEFQWIANNLKEVKEILIDDDTFSMKHAHAREVAKELIKIGNKIPWSCQIRADLDFETLKLMRQSGCRLVVTGFESIDQNVLNNIKKGIRQSSVDDFVDSVHRAGIKFHADFMAGNPGDTIDTLQATLEWALSKNFDTFQFFPLQVYPGTTAYNEALKDGRLKIQPFRSWITSDGMHNITLINNDMGLTEQQVLDFCDYARQRFYLRPRYILRKSLDLFLDYHEFKKNLIGFMKIRKHLFRKVSGHLS